MVRLPDLLSKDLDVVFCGINPALSAARVGHHFSSRSNRFWRVLVSVYERQVERKTVAAR